MNQSKHAALFLKILASVALIWGSAFYLFLQSTQADGVAQAFLQILFFTCLDLAAIVILFWKLFFSQGSKAKKKFDLILWLFFKLVCLAFLAITLKRLTNAPFNAVLLGVGFIGVGPIMAGMIFKAATKGKQNAR